MRRLSLLVLALASGACAGAELEGRASGLRAQVQRAWDQGAYRCAPRELATAEANVSFAEQDLREGNYHAAKAELEIADENVEKALARSPRGKCAGAAEAPPNLDADGDGILDDADACPEEPEDVDRFQDKDGCPDPDNDADGVVDAEDACPDTAEDVDSFEDQDGCPELDNDGDGLTDAIDQCPAEAEDKDDFQDDDGCPDPDNDGDKVLDAADKCPTEYAETPDGCPQKYQLIVVTREKIELKQTIYFDTNKDTIKPVSYPLLNEVARALADRGSIEVRIEGHTDSRGPDQRNLTLSQARAESVRQYLIGQGVAAARMTAQGFGETRPIADNRTTRGRDRNRRVEFVITKQD